MNGMTPTAAIDEVLSVPRSDLFRYKNKNKNSEPSLAIYEPGPEPSYLIPSNEDLGNPFFHL
jgi:hypothetical protein